MTATVPSRSTWEGERWPTGLVQVIGNGFAAVATVSAQRWKISATTGPRRARA